VSCALFRCRSARVCGWCEKQEVENSSFHFYSDDRLASLLLCLKLMNDIYILRALRNIFRWSVLSSLSPRCLCIVGFHHIILLSNALPWKNRASFRLLDAVSANFLKTGLTKRNFAIFRRFKLRNVFFSALKAVFRIGFPTVFHWTGGKGFPLFGSFWPKEKIYGSFLGLVIELCSLPLQ